MLAVEDKQFILPDLFVTAKDLRMLDEGQKRLASVNKKWKSKLYMNKNTGFQLNDQSILSKIKLDEEPSGLFFNEAALSFGFPSFLSFSIYHGYEWEKKPYFIILNRSAGDPKYAGFTKDSGKFFVAMEFDAQNIVNFEMKENNVGDAKLNSIQAAWKTFWHIPISYQVKIFNAAANATVGNTGISYFQNNLSLDIGDVSILNTLFPSLINLDTLNSNNNSYVGLELLLNKEINFMSVPNHFQFGINAWTNKGATKLGLLLRDNLSFQLTKNVQVDAGVDISNSKIKVDDIFDFDFAEIDDPKLEPDEKAELTLTINNYFGIHEKLLVSYTDYPNLKVWDDAVGDGYYNMVNVKNVQVLKLGAMFKDVQVLSENIDILVQLPLYNKDVANQFSKFAEVSYEKAIYGGMFNTIASYYLRELGRSPGTFKNAYLNIDMSYEQAINPNMYWGLTLGNLLSSGAEKLSGIKIGSTFLFLNVRFIF